MKAWKVHGQGLDLAGNNNNNNKDFYARAGNKLIYI